MDKLIGCSKDHSKEIDLYEKTYGEKIDRVKTMMSHAEQALDEIDEMKQNGELSEEKIKETEAELLQKCSYYYSQALLVFYYLIPDNKEQGIESDGLKFKCHLAAAETRRRQKRYLEALEELSIAKGMYDIKEYGNE